MEKQTFLTFLLGKEYFAVQVNKVIEVLEKQNITKVPQTPAHILGIINFRGEILPVVDTRQKFSLPSILDNDKHFIIIYEIKTETCKFTIAATADAVKDVIEIDDSEIKPVPEIGIRYDARYISGAIYRNNEFILLLDIDKVFTCSDNESVENIEVPETIQAETA